MSPVDLEARDFRFARSAVGAGRLSLWAARWISPEASPACDSRQSPAALPTPAMMPHPRTECGCILSILEAQPHEQTAVFCYATDSPGPDIHNRQCAVNSEV